MACCELHHRAATIDLMLVAMFGFVFFVAVVLLIVISVFFTGRRGRRQKFDLPATFKAKPPPSRAWSPLATKSTLTRAPSWQQAAPSSYNASPRNLDV
eukprot:gene18976-25552_t